MRHKIKQAFPYVTEMEIDQMIQSMNDGGFDLDDVIKAFQGFETFCHDLP